MLRFLVILSLIVYVVYKIGSLFFKAGAASQHLRDQQRKNFDDNVNASTSQKRDKKSGSKPGEYIDYEEVK
jgi:hypothetical protein